MNTDALDDHAKYRNSIDEAGKRHHRAVAEIERKYAADLSTAKQVHDATIETGPKIRGSNWQGQRFEVPDPDVQKAAGAAYVKACEAAEKARDKAKVAAAAEHSKEVEAARRTWRASEGFQGFY